MTHTADFTAQMFLWWSGDAQWGFYLISLSRAGFILHCDSEMSNMSRELLTADVRMMTGEELWQEATQIQCDPKSNRIQQKDYSLV